MTSVSINNGKDDLSIEQILQAQAHICNHCYNFVSSMCLKCAVELGIPNAIHSQGGPMTLNQLVEATQVIPGKARGLYRVMRVLVRSGFFDIVRVGERHEETEAYSLNNVSKLLLRDNSLSLEPYVRATLNSPIPLGMFDRLSVWLQNDHNHLVRTVLGLETVWDMTGLYPEESSLFIRGLASESHIVGKVMVDHYKSVFEGLNSLIDVGGGTGVLGRVIADAFPLMECIVFDFPQVFAGQEGTKNLKYVGGDIFDNKIPLPPADAILMKSVLHDWPDKQSIDILKKCKEAISGRDLGKLIIIDMVVDNPAIQDENIRATQCSMDVYLIGIMGIERTEEEWAKLFADVGFSRYEINHQVGMQSIIEVYP